MFHARLPVICAVAIAAALAGACSDSPVQPSNPAAPPAPGATDNPVVRLSVKADESGARDAIATLSETVVDASASTGTGALTFALDFGDGARATTPTARHVYGGPGTYTVSVEVRDAQGRSASASQQVAVKSLTGGWFHAGYNPNVHHVEIRRLEITSQEGQTIRGVYKLSNAPDRSFTGTLRAPRAIRIVADTTTLDGAIPGRVNEESEPWTLQVQGGSLNGEPLAFTFVPAAPTGPEPDADLRIRVDHLGSKAAILGLSPIEFDGSASRGVGLAYFHDFGDDQTSTAARPVHPATRAGLATARLTVVDRFGRFDTESIDYAVITLDGPLTSWYANEGSDFLSFVFTKRTGATFDGRARLQSAFGDSVPCVASLSGERDIRITVPALGLEFRGYIDLSGTRVAPEQPSNVPPMFLTQVGGARNGKVWELHFDNGPG